MLNHEAIFWLAFMPWLAERNTHELYHPHYPEAGSELNIVDGWFFPPMLVKD